MTRIVLKSVDNSTININIDSLPEWSFFRQFETGTTIQTDLWHAQIQAIHYIELGVREASTYPVREFQSIPGMPTEWMARCFPQVAETPSDVEVLDVEEPEAEPEPEQLTWAAIGRDVKSLISSGCCVFSESARRARDDRFAAAEAMLATLRQRTVELNLGQYGFRYLELWDAMCNNSGRKIEESIRCLTDELKDQLLESLGEASPHAFRALEHATRVVLGLSSA